MRRSALLAVALGVFTSCSDEPTDVDTLKLTGEFAGAVRTYEDRVGIALTNATLNDEPAGSLNVWISGEIRDVWGHDYEPDEITPGTPVRARAYDCLETDETNCAADDLIVELPFAGTGAQPR